MNRKVFLRRLALLSAAPFVLPACRIPSEGPTGAEVRGVAARDSLRFTRLVKSKAEWQALLPPAAFAVLFEEATERAFSSPLNAEKRKGTFICAACNLPLFPSTTKFDSGTGWPSFYQPFEGRIATKVDRSLGMLRSEYHCARCGGHQGHVFDDGPPPTGLRYCNNGVALRFVPAAQPLPELRS